MAKRHVFSQMFDIRPTDAAGNVDHGRIKNIHRIIKLERKKNALDLAKLQHALRLEKTQAHPKNSVNPILSFSSLGHTQDKLQQESWIPDDSYRNSPSTSLRIFENPRDDIVRKPEGDRVTSARSTGLEGHNFLPSRDAVVREIECIEERDRKLALLGYLSQELERNLTPDRGQTAQISTTPKTGTARRFRDHMRHLTIAPRVLGAITAGAIVMGIGGFWGTHYVSQFSDAARVRGGIAYQRMQEGVRDVFARDFAGARQKFAAAAEDLSHLGGALWVGGRWLALVSDTFSVSSEPVSQIHLLEAAEHFAKAGEELAAYAELFTKNGLGTLTPREFIQGYLSATDLQKAKLLLASAVAHLYEAQEHLAAVDIETLPEEFRESLKSLGKKMPSALAVAKQFSSLQDSLFEVLGYLGPRKYLVVFQNNAELRPTGGFIGSYALVDVLDGKVTRLFVDDVFNIDGQLVDKVIPPLPIQKISTAWSLHDANWFFDYPTSAQKIAWFYEKAGGATIDGVIAVTPNVLERLLSLAGTLELPAYGITLTPETFRDELSYLIEEATPKHEGESPKIVLRDIATLLFDSLRARWDERGSGEILALLQESLTKRDILLWTKEPAIETLITAQGWGGQILVSDGDYLAVVHANINGYKTDRVIRERITHEARIALDGSVIDMVTITRDHPGSPAERYDELYEQVNADYLRVYVPKGSELLEAAGHTIEESLPPIDYEEARFAKDADVEGVESSMWTHYPSGTHIYEESGKTVFGNWVYVSPGESVTVRYVYKLPWRIPVGPNAVYTMLVQKQPGVEQATFTGSVRRPDGAESAIILDNVPLEKDVAYSSAVR